jgi:pimeloyl-ACP methyl ester carboxylesterase
MQTIRVQNGAIELAVTVQGEGPLIVCVHGWPELGYSWRHQQRFFAARGYRIATMDVRGYGNSSRPEAVADYSMRHLCADVAAVIQTLGAVDPKRPARAILFGHDWGAPIAWNTAVLFPQYVRAVAGLSVPFVPIRSRSFLELAAEIYRDRFFYQLYFQEEGRAEADFSADVGSALRKVYYALSGEGIRDTAVREAFVTKSKDDALLVGLVDPDPFPAWLTAEDLHVFTETFSRTGFRGAFNRYRAQTIDVAELAHIAGQPVVQPACFIAGAEDPVRNFVPGVDAYAKAGQYCRDLRGSHILPGVGHWVQQEAPELTNQHLTAFLNTLSETPSNP